MRRGSPVTVMRSVSLAAVMLLSACAGQSEGRTAPPSGQLASAALVDRLNTACLHELPQALPPPGRLYERISRILTENLPGPQSLALKQIRRQISASVTLLKRSEAVRHAALTLPSGDRARAQKIRAANRIMMRAGRQTGGAMSALNDLGVTACGGPNVMP